MVIKGSIISVVYRNNDNGFSVVRIKSNGDEVIVTGKFPPITTGEDITVDGDFAFNDKYGKQFVVNKFEINEPTTTNQIIAYLSSGLFKGIGPKTAEKIVNVFGDKTFETIENNPSSITSQVHLSNTIVLNLHTAYKDNKNLQQAVMYLQNYDVSLNTAIKIYNKYHDNTEVVLKTNPYKLVEDVEQIGFLTADKLAQKMGISPDSEFRIRAAAVFVLKTLAEKKGSTVIKVDELKETTFKLLGLTDTDTFESKYDKVITELCIDKVVSKYKIEDNDLVGLDEYLNMEKFIAQKLAMVVDNNNLPQLDVGAEISLFELKNGITFDESQKKAIKSAVNNNIVVITGGPGTGKTTIIKAINEILKTKGYRTLLLAPTGRASKRLSEATGEEAKTIHRGLNIIPGVNKKEFTDLAKMGVDTLIIDEVSMVDTQVMYNIAKTIMPNVRLVLIGDKDQLPSVGAGNILADLISMDIIPVFTLTQIFRQANDSKIIENAHKINKGKLLDVNDLTKDFYVVPMQEQEKIASTIIELVTKRLPNYLRIDPNKIQVLAPIKKGVAGVEDLNTRLQNSLNPKSFGASEMKMGETIFRVGDRVINIANNYKQQWYKRNGEIGEGIYNGDIGYINDINSVAGQVEVSLEDGRLTNYTLSDIDNLKLAYAITVHKSQGSEFDVVVLPIIGGSPQILTRNWLYTAVTRGKSMVVLVGRPDQVNYIIQNNTITKRNTMLKYFVEDSLKKNKLDSFDVVEARNKIGIKDELKPFKKNDEFNGD